QPETGNQTSILMSESLEGVRVAATRQKAGRVENCEAALAAPPGVGCAEAPAATGFADVIVVSGNFSEARFSQEDAKPGDPAKENITNIKKVRIFLSAMIYEPPLSLARHQAGTNLRQVRHSLIPLSGLLEGVRRMKHDRVTSGGKRRFAHLTRSS